MYAYVIQHIAFEHLGNLEPVLLEHGFLIRTFVAGINDLQPVRDDNPDLLIVLGAPIGIYENDSYQYLEIELSFIKNRIDRGRPVLGICLGCQLVARALGAHVYPGSVKEIGWSGLQIHKNVTTNPLSALNRNNSVLHWHGDTFDLPHGANLLASSSNYTNQAFSYGESVLALQFHLEVRPEDLESWYLGHAHEIGSIEGLSVNKLRNDGERFAPVLQEGAKRVWEKWVLSVKDTLEAGAVT